MMTKKHRNQKQARGYALSEEEQAVTELERARKKVFERALREGLPSGAQRPQSEAIAWMADRIIELEQQKEQTP